MCLLFPLKIQVLLPSGAIHIHDKPYCHYSETCVKRPLSKRPKNGFQDQLSLNVGQKYSAMLSTFIKLSFVI